MGTIYFICFLILLLNNMEVYFTFLFLNTIVKIILLDLYLSVLIIYYLLFIWRVLNILIINLYKFIIAIDTRFFII